MLFTYKYQTKKKESIKYKTYNAIRLKISFTYALSLYAFLDIPLSCSLGIIYIIHRIPVNNIVHIDEDFWKILG